MTIPEILNNRCQCSICGYAKELNRDFNTWNALKDRNPGFYPITNNGSPSGGVQGMICAKCLRSANSMRKHIKAFVSNIQVTRHARLRYIERADCTLKDDQAIDILIIKLFEKARLIRFSRRFTIERILNNDGKTALYYLFENLVFVVNPGKPSTILTVELLGNKKPGRDYVLAETSRY